MTQTTNDVGLQPFVATVSAPTVWSRVAKRAVDLVGASVALVIFSPILLASAISIRRGDRGPILFRQERIGQNEERFDILKLRTMTVDNDDSEHRAYASALLNDEAEATEDGVFKLTNDPRITKAGALLRRYSIDELPQLINVLKGEMSLVGPRPALEYEIVHYSAEHRQRAIAKPGCTGLWQVSGRSRITMLEMLDLDVEYARSSSLFQDVQILVRTPWAILRGDGAR